MGTTLTHQFGVLTEGLPSRASAGGHMGSVLWHIASSMETELVVGLFHASFGIMTQLRKAVPSLWHHGNHSYSPIWSADRGAPL